MAAVLFADVAPVPTLLISLLLIMGMVVGFFALLRLEILQRKQYALLHEERDQNSQLHQEIAHRKSLEEQLRVLAERDALTKLNNRGHFMNVAKQLLQSCQADRTPFSLLMIDVDHFKHINDTWGAQLWRWGCWSVLPRSAPTRCAPSDVIGRFGGEEFVVALPSTSAAEAEHIAERLKQRVAALVFKDGVSELTPSVTIGVATKDAEASGLEALIKRADELLYEGKRAGRDRVVVGREGLSPR